MAGPAILTAVCQYSFGALTLTFNGQIGELELSAVSVENSVIAGLAFGVIMRRKQSQPPCLTHEVQDRITSLPDHVVDQILSHLPIRDAVRTSVLSSKWRPIKKFKLSHCDLIVGAADIDKWTLHLCRRSIQELVLEIWKGQRYKIPSCLFACQSLIHLELFNCWLRPPSTFLGFSNLKSLDLQHVTLAQDVFENLISSCHLLERLTLINFDGFTRLNIDAPKLQYFDIGGIFEDVNFKNTSQLAVVSIGLYLNSDDLQSTLHGSSNNLLQFFVQQPHVRRLEIQSYFLKYLAAGVVPHMLPIACMDLNYLSISINFNDAKEISAALCLIRSSPILLDLEILQIGLSADTFFLEDANWRCPVLLQLRHVRIEGICGMRSELDFIYFLLLRSPVLEELTVKPAALNGGLEIEIDLELIREMSRFRRTSGQAEIIFLDP